MARRNPYERRGRKTGAEIGWTDLASRPRMRPWAIRLEDLDALALSVRANAVEVERDRLSEQHREELGDASRRAWDEGHGAGRRDGVDELLSRIGRQFELRARDLVEAADRQIDAAVGFKSPEHIALRKVTERLAAFVSELITAHHEGFGAPAESSPGAADGGQLASEALLRETLGLAGGAPTR